MSFFQSLQGKLKMKRWYNYYLEFLQVDLGASLIAQLVKNPPAMKKTLVQFLGQEDPLEKG